MTNQINELFAKALGIAEPWFVKEVDFDAERPEVTIRVDFVRGTKFRHPRAPGEHNVHDTEIKRLRHLNFFQHRCMLEVRVPKLKLPDGYAEVEPDWVGKLSGFTLLFEALVLNLAQHMPFAAVARPVDESWHRVNAVRRRYVDLAIAATDLPQSTSVAIDETSYQKGQRYLTLVADADARKVVHVSKGAGAANVAGFARHLRKHNGAADNITSVAIDMSMAFIKGVTENLPKAVITFDKFHVVAHASQAVDKMRRIEQKTDPTLKGFRWALLKDRRKLSREQANDLDHLVARFTTKRTARAWLYREQLRDILFRKQYVVCTMLRCWCTNVMRSKVIAHEGGRRDDPQPFRRHRELDAITVRKAKERLEARGVEAPEPASLSLTLPILVAAADESRDELQDLWARLLAAAADPSRAVFFRLRFIDAAKRMDPLDATVLSSFPVSGAVRPPCSDRLGTPEKSRGCSVSQQVVKRRGYSSRWVSPSRRRLTGESGRATVKAALRRRSVAAPHAPFHGEAAGLVGEVPKLMQRGVVKGRRGTGFLAGSRRLAA